MKYFTLVLLGIAPFYLYGQSSIEPEKVDSVYYLKEINLVVLSSTKIKNDTKRSVNVDEYLANNQDISFIKRGAFAWEPLLNNMASERASLTIDGMHVFGACTDKMDPITSYVETNNLSGVEISSGQQGTMNGATIAGSIDLKRKSTPFGLAKSLSATYQSGFEFNNNQLYNLANIAYSQQNYAMDASVSYRNASNYYDGHDNKVEHSQYAKFNTSLGFYFKTSDLSSIAVQAIFDQANNVGFPALPMDLLLSRALITSIEYKKDFEQGIVKKWDTKLYFNTIEHYMDDTNRPENVVHMDMPGWSTTYGIVTKVNLEKDSYQSDIQLNAYSNYALAEMTMYPQDYSNTTMFAYSWPGITTSFASFAVNNSWKVSSNGLVQLTGALGVNYNHAKYIEFNHVFHPGAVQSKIRILPSFQIGYSHNKGQWDFSLSSGYGQRAPSVSEGYGYYMYNSFDRYDYIGNPDLVNETSYDTSITMGWRKNKLSIQSKANLFYIQNYIVGQIIDVGSPMNYQSVGVKGYTSLPYATLFNFSVNAQYTLPYNTHVTAGLTYARAKDNMKHNLPFIRPLSYMGAIHWSMKGFSLQGSYSGDFKQKNYSAPYGEAPKKAYAIFNISGDYTLYIGPVKSTIQIGAENLFNIYYTTYADWGSTPRMGRNFFTSLKLSF